MGRSVVTDDPCEGREEEKCGEWSGSCVDVCGVGGTAILSYAFGYISGVLVGFIDTKFLKIGYISGVLVGFIDTQFLKIKIH